MRPTLLLLFALLPSSLSLSQIPNAGFELWQTDPDSNLSPVGWQTTNSFPLVNVEPYAPGRQGNYAMRVKTLNPGFPFPGVAIVEAAYNFSETPTRFSAWVRSYIMPGDRAYIIVGLMKGDSVVALMDSCTFKIDSTFAQFTYREFRIANYSNLVPDSLVVIVASGLGSGQVGTELIVDDIAFSGGSTNASEHEILPSSFLLHQNYPNPFNPTTHIKFEIPRSGEVSLKVFDVLGRVVSVLAHEKLEAGSYERTFDAAGLSSGVYYYALVAEGFVQTKKLLLLR